MGQGRRLTISRSERFLGSYGSGDRHVGCGGAAFFAAGSELMEGEVWSVVEDGAERDPEVSSGCYGGGGRSSVARARDVGGRRHMASSAPVKVPDWRKILRGELLQDDWVGADAAGSGSDEEMVPPHEWVARGRREGGASVFVGVGRTLKGRDMRRVRDAVWSQTGFDG